MSLATDAPRCAVLSRQLERDPIGTAGTYRGFLLMEVPLPWPRDVSQLPEMAAVRPVVDGLGLRIQAVVATGGPRRVVLHRNPLPDRFAGYARAETTVGDPDADVVPGDALAAAIAELLGRPPADPGGGPAGTGAGAGAPARDVLICTHGRRDVCCGSLGTTLALEVADVPLGPGGRLWRTSHTGGHRFAPTMFVLPEATAWAYVDRDLVERVVQRRGDAADVASRYRGCAGIGGRGLQALEREVLRQVGWDLLDRPRWGAELEGGRVQLTVERPGGGHDVWEGEVSPGRTLPVPDCGEPAATTHKTETELLVTGVHRLAH